MQCVSDNLKRRGVRCKSHTTQFVVGAGEERDQEILATLFESYQHQNLGRGYFSAFQPIPFTPLEGKPPAPAVREHRLYQVDFLFRTYGFTESDILFDEAGNLSLQKDPKQLWAEAHPEFFPVRAHSASREALLRVPGIGPISARRIGQMRKLGRLHGPEDVKIKGQRRETVLKYLVFE